MAKLVVLASVFVLVVACFAWSNLQVTDERGERVAIREAMVKYLNGEKLRPLREALTQLWHFYQVHGLGKLIDHLLYEGGDKYAVANAYKVRPTYGWRLFMW